LGRGPLTTQKFSELSDLSVLVGGEEKKKKRKEEGIAPATGGDWDGMDGAKTPPPAGGKRELEVALLHIIQHHHHQSLRQRQQTGTVRRCVRVPSYKYP